MRIKAVAESPRLPDEVKNGVAKPDISEEERAALHNVTSGLNNQPKVRATLEAAIADICRVLQVPVPDKKGRLKKGDKKKSEPATRKDSEEQPADRAVKNAPEEKGTKNEEKHVKSKALSEDRKSDDDESEWGGLSEHDDDEEIVEKALSRFDDRLGGFDSDTADSDGDEEYDTANEELDPMEITDESASEESDSDEPGSQSGEDEDGSSDSEEGSVSGSESESESGSQSDSDSDVSAISPPPKASRKELKKVEQIRREGGALPSLMGGYISGSESEASDIDVAPAARKNRRGQRARQAIWEKKFKEKAKHLAQDKPGRDSGWDLKRGAVDGSERTPWKKGIKTPFEKRPDDRHDWQEYAAPEPKRPRPPTKKDDEGPLHPSWEARKKAKEAQETAAFQGKKITFD